MSEIQRIPPPQSPAERTGEARPAGERRQRPREKPRGRGQARQRERVLPDPAGEKPREETPGPEEPGTGIDLQA